jgi:hypothetical protein
MGAVLTLALRDEVTFVAEKGSWYLFESRLPRVPFDADDAHLPEPHPPTLRRKLKELASEIEAASQEPTNPHGQHD